MTEGGALAAGARHGKPAVVAPAALLFALGAALIVATEFIVIGLAPTMVRDLGLSPAETGRLVTLFALASALLGPVLVLGATRLAPVHVLTLALLPFAANALLWAWPSYLLASLLRVAQGATLPVFMSIAATTLTGLLSGRDQKAVAILYFGVTLGGTLGAPAGAALAERIGWQGVLAGLGVATAIVALAMASLRRLARERPPASQLGILRDARLRTSLIGSALIFAAMFASYSYLALLLGRAGYTSGAISGWLLLFGGGGLLGNMVASRISSGLARMTTAALAAIAIAALWVGTGASRPVTLGAVILLWGAAHAALFVLCQLSAMRAAPDAPGFAASLNIAAANIGIAGGAFGGGEAIARFGLSAVAPLTALLAILACLACAAWRPVQPA